MIFNSNSIILIYYCYYYYCYGFIVIVSSSNSNVNLILKKSKSCHVDWVLVVYLAVVNLEHSSGNENEMITRLGIVYEELKSDVQGV